METTIKTVIIDDDKPSAILLQKALKDYKNVEVSEIAYNDLSGKGAILKQQPRLLFLDIELGSVSGFDFLKTMRPLIDWNMSVVFYTSYEKYTLQALRMEAFDFLLKPFGADDLKIVMERFFKKGDSMTMPKLPPAPERKERPMLINTITNNKVILRANEVGYFRFNAENKFWEVILCNLKRLILKHNATADNILNYSSDFVQIHKRFIININYLSLFDDKGCIMQYPFNDITELKISRTYRKKLIDKFYNI